MVAIFKKDFASIFHSVIGWLFLAIFWGLMSLYIGMYCFIGLDPNITDVLSISATILMVLLPILCMRSFAEERKTGTDQMILTAPVSVGGIVMGKFLALALVYSIGVAALCLYPVLLSRYGNVPFAESYTGLFGMWLFGLCEIAVCIFISSLTESVIIAAVVSVAALFLTLIMPNLEAMISSQGNWFTSFLSVLDIPSRFDTFLNGTLNVGSIVYLVSVTGLFLFFTTQVIQKRRYEVSRKTLGFGTYSVGMIAVVTAIVVVVNLTVNRLPSSMTSFDMTSGGLYSLTEETKDYLSQLDEDVTIYVMAGENDKDETLDLTLNDMAEQTDHLTITYVDPASNPSFLQEYSDVLDAYWNSLIVESSERYTVVDYTDIYEYSVDYTTYISTISGYDAEGQIDSAIAYVISEVLPKVYVLTGHDEQELGSNFTEVLSKLNSELVDLDLMTTESVPDDCEILIINGPKSDLSSDDADKILSYLASGGNLIAVTSFEADLQEMTNYAEVLAFYGVEVSSGIVLENNQGYYYRYESYLLPDVAQTEETQDITNGYVFAAYSQALFEDEEAQEEGTIIYTDLLTTSEKACIREGVTETTTNFAITFQDETSQYVLGLKAEVDLGATQDSTSDSDDTTTEDSAGDSDDTTSEESTSDDDAAEVSTGYLFGSDMIFSDSADQMVSGSNSDLFSGMIETTVDQEGMSTPISVDAKTVSSSYLTIPTMTSIILCLVFIVVIPVVLLIVGIVVWMLRRRQ